MNGEQKRKQNERKFEAWDELPNGKRQMKITRQKIGQKLIDYLYHRITLAELVDWAESAMMEAKTT